MDNMQILFQLLALDSDCVVNDTHWMVVTPDKIDKTILHGMLSNCRARCRTLAKKTGLSPNAVPVEFWAPWRTVSEPVMFTDFLVENLQGAERILNRIRKAPFVISTTLLVSFPAASSHT